MPPCHGITAFVSYFSIVCRGEREVAQGFSLRAGQGGSTQRWGLHSMTGEGRRCHPSPPDRLHVEAWAHIPSAAPIQGGLIGSGWTRHLITPSIVMSHTCLEKFSHSRVPRGRFELRTLHLDTAHWLPAALSGCRNNYTSPHLLPKAGPHQPRLAPCWWPTEPIRSRCLRVNPLVSHVPVSRRGDPLAC